MTPTHYFWAKLGTAKWPERYHPLVCHAVDVGNVARELWRQMGRPLQQQFADALSIENEVAARWVAFWIAAHDIGKVTPCFQFQGQTEELKKQLTDTFNTASGKEHHTETGTKILNTALRQGGESWPSLPEPIVKKIVIAVGGHHGTFPTKWQDIVSLLGNDHWAAARKEILDRLAVAFGLTNETPTPTVRGSDQSVWMLLAGLTSVADWIGSNEEFFPWAGSPQPFDLEQYILDSRKKAAEALQSVGWHPPSPRDSPRGFNASTGITEPRPLQDQIIPIAEGMHSPRLILIEAPMGEGKTEAAWYVADCWQQFGGAGTYVALPTMATSNQMFERVKQFLELAGGGNLMLQHGKAALNEQFEKLKFAARLYDPDSTSGVVAESWFANNKKHGLLAPFGVGTIDQALLSVLQTKHFFVRLFGLAGKCIILDEVHAYDAYMTTLLKRLLKWLAALGCPVVLLSATLPAEKRIELLESYAGTSITPTKGWGEYPRIVSVGVGDETAEVQNFAASGTKEIHLNWIEDTTLVENIRERLKTGGCAAVIRNTVGLAQETYLRLKEVLAGSDIKIEVELFHARFPFGRRQEIETDVLKRYGKSGDAAGRNKRVLVATQVVEQSLDIDFDVMYTDVAPVDLVLQRAGRLHRHERGERGEPQLWLINPGTKDDDTPDFGASEWVYDAHLLFRSQLVLRGSQGTVRTKISLPNEIESLIEAVYTKSEPPSDLSTVEKAHWLATQEKHKSQESQYKGKAEERQIKKPTYSGAFGRMCDNPREEDDPTLHPAHQAPTRLTRPTVHIICLMKDPAGNWTLLHDERKVESLKVRPRSEGGIEDLQRLLEAEISVADARVLKALREDPHRPQDWEKVGMLERHHLIEFLNGTVSFGDLVLTLDKYLGLRVTRANEEGDE
jgi:CRISPR-associated endonuclease/helicase Cas3